MYQGKTEEQRLDDLLSERIQSLEGSVEVIPEDLHREVFSTLDTFNFLGELAEFFTVKFTEAEFAIFDAANEAFLGTRD